MNTLDVDWSKINKNVARKITINKYVGVHRKDRARLFMPGNQCLCVKEALKNGQLNILYRLIVVENSPSVMEIIKNILSELGFVDVYYHCGDLYDLDLIEASGGKLIDYFNLDTCNNVNSDISNWIVHIPKHIVAKKAIFAMNSCNPRGSAPWFNKNFGYAVWEPGKSSKEELEQSYFSRTEATDGHHFIYNGEVYPWRNYKIHRGFWTKDAFEQGIKRMKAIRDHANALSLFLNMNFNIEYLYGCAYHDGKTWMHTNIFRILDVKSVEVENEQYTMSLLYDFNPIKVVKMINTRRNIVEKQKNILSKELEDILNNNDLTKMQKAGYKALYNGRIKDICRDRPIGDYSFCPEGYPPQKWAWDVRNPKRIQRDMLPVVTKKVFDSDVL